jgi:hypothetical protein
MNSVFNETCTNHTNTTATNINISMYNVSIQTCKINLHLYEEKIGDVRHDGSFKL